MYLSDHMCTDTQGRIRVGAAELHNWPVSSHLGNPDPQSTCATTLVPKLPIESDPEANRRKRIVTRLVCDRRVQAPDARADILHFYNRESDYVTRRNYVNWTLWKVQTQPRRRSDV